MKFISFASIALILAPAAFAHPQQTRWMSEDKMGLMPVESANCAGSGLCKLVNRWDCVKAIEELVAKQTDKGVVAGPLDASHGHCTAFYKCELTADYREHSVGVDTLAGHMESLWVKHNCQKCGSVEFADRQAYQGTGEYRIVFSREAITATTRATLWAVPVNTTDLRTLLQTAKADAANHSAHDRSTPFTSTTKGLRLVMTSIEKAQCPDSFNWEDYGTVSDVLLQSVVAESDSRNSIVGVVVDPTGKPLVDVIVLPAYVYINKYRTVDSSEPLQTLPRDVSPRDRHSQHDIAALDLASSEWTTRSRVEKRDKIRPVQGTDLTLHVRTVAAQTTAYALSVLASYAVNAIHCDSTLRRHQNFLSGYSIFETSKLLDTDFLGGVVFHLRSTAGPIKGHDMVEIVRSINQIIRKRSLDRDLDDRVPALVGKVVNAAGYAVAHWSVGIAVAAASSVCAEALVVNPDGTGALGYLTSYTDL
ncbi:MAG: hypothetical protein M1817_001830 [Caeruleum heppii]|nr:MAG: hypothetical protein M1817_001830 [Caeruleum heppii]